MGVPIEPDQSVHYIKTRNTGSHMVEVHVFKGPWYREGPGTYGVMNGHFVTPFTLVDAQYGFFRVAREALIYIKTAATGSGTIEVHISRFANGSYGTPEHWTTGFDLTTAQHGTFDTTEEDLWYFQTSNAGINNVRVKIAPKSNNYIPNFSADSGMPCTEAACGTLHGANNNLILIKTKNTASGTIEMHGLTRGSNFKLYYMRSPTAFPLADVPLGDFLISNKPHATAIDLTFMKRVNTRQNLVEMHVAHGDLAYKELPLQPESSPHYVDQIYAKAPQDPIGKMGFDIQLQPSDVGNGGYLLVSNFEESYDTYEDHPSAGNQGPWRPGAAFFPDVPSGPGDE